MFMALNGSLRAIIGVTDVVRPEAASVVGALQQRGIPCYMITGDEEATALAVARAVGIPPSHILARAKPEDKRGFIAAIQRQGEGVRVAFVGDGTNDSPALAQADVGVAVAHSTQLAIEAADVQLAGDDLRGLLVALGGHMGVGGETSPGWPTAGCIYPPFGPFSSIFA